MTALLPSRTLDSGPLEISLYAATRQALVDLQPLGTNDLRTDLLSSHTGKGFVQGETDGVDRDVSLPVGVFEEGAL